MWQMIVGQGKVHQEPQYFPHFLPSDIDNLLGGCPWNKLLQFRRQYSGVPLVEQLPYSEMAAKIPVRF